MYMQIPIVLIPPIVAIGVYLGLWSLTSLPKARIVSIVTKAFMLTQLLCVYAGLSYLDSQEQTPYSGVFLILMIALALLLGGVRRMK
jgi:hypothetical protein